MHKSHKTKSESEEYDTLGSDSDTEVGTSSRTESSNHLVDSHHSAAADSRVHSMTVLIFSINKLNSIIIIILIFFFSFYISFCSSQYNFDSLDEKFP